VNIAIVSGKGGSGKTTVAVNLFSYLKDVTLIDADTEAPNDHLYLPGEDKKDTVYKEIPVIDQSTCTLCHQCSNFCAFHAIVPTKTKMLVFDDLCHDCHGCHLVCEEGAITYQQHPIGTIIERTIDEKPFFTGTLSIGEQSGNKIIETMKDKEHKTKHTIIDGPPGVSCKTVETLENVDYAILVIEDSLFGLHDADMVVELLNDLSIPFGVIINKAFNEVHMVKDYIKENNLKLLVRIPFNRRYQKLGSEGKLLTNEISYQKTLNTIAKKVGIL
jgi:MinD superfamily P-loop ATPase